MTIQAPTYDLAAARDKLLSLREVTYVNSGTEGIMAEPVLDAYFDTLRFFERFGHWARTQLVAEMDGCRTRLATLVNAAVEEVAVTRNGTDGVSIVLGCFPFAEGDELLIGSEEHPAITYPAYALQTTQRIRVHRFVFEHNPTRTLANFEAALTPRTRLAAFSHVSCETGIRNPAAEMIALAHRRGVPVLLDGAQSVGTLPLDFRALDADYLTGSVHKWLCGPKGTGVLYVRRDCLDGLTPRYVGGGSLADTISWDKVRSGEATTVAFHPTASRFEYGMRNPAIYAGVSRAIDYLESLGWNAIRAHQRSVSDYLKERILATPGLRLQTPREWENSSPIVNVAVEGVAGADVSKRLWNEWKIVQRAVRDPNGVRISFNYFNSHEDADGVVTALTAIRDSRDA